MRFELLFAVVSIDKVSVIFSDSDGVKTTLDLLGCFVDPDVVDSGTSTLS